MPESESQISHFSNAALAYLTSDPDELLRFMQLTGYDPQSLRESLETNEFQSAIMGYFVQNEPLLLSMCANASIDPNRFTKLWMQENRYEG